MLPQNTEETMWKDIAEGHSSSITWRTLRVDKSCTSISATTSAYLSTLCRELGAAGHELTFRRARRIMKAYSADSALRHLRKKHPSEMARLNEPAAAAYAYLAARAPNMQYGRLRKQGFFIASGHIESACKFIVGSRCKQAGMHWRHYNAAYVSAVRAAIRSNTFWVS